MNNLEHRSLKYLFTSVIVVLMVLLLSACQPLGNPEIVETTPTAISLPGSGRIAKDNGLLMLILSDAGNEPPLSEATVIVFSNDIVFHTGQTKGGAYRTSLPVGNYDVALLIGSTPPGGLIKRGVVIKKDETEILAVTTQSEGILTTLLRSPNGYPPQHDFSIIISAEDQEITRKLVRTASAGKSGIALRTDLIYDLKIQYRDLELGEGGVIVPADGTEIELILPYNEGVVDLEIRAGGQSLEEEAAIVLLDQAGKVIAIGTTVAGRYFLVLPADTDYIARVQYLNQVEERSLSVIPGSMNPQIIDFKAPRP